MSRPSSVAGSTGWGSIAHPLGDAGKAQTDVAQATQVAGDLRTQVDRGSGVAQDDPAEVDLEAVQPQVQPT